MAFYDGRRRAGARRNLETTFQFRRAYPRFGSFLVSGQTRGTVRIPLRRSFDAACRVTLREFPPHKPYRVMGCRIGPIPCHPHGPDYVTRVRYQKWHHM